uniref:Uncharacterized protein n=1 Tax=Ditylenchus dipsaci TaxID=166011 RepID=A0A915D3Q2_9BILA
MYFKENLARAHHSRTAISHEYVQQELGDGLRHSFQAPSRETGQCPSTAHPSMYSNNNDILHNASIDNILQLRLLIGNIDVFRKAVRPLRDLESMEWLDKWAIWDSSSKTAEIGIVQNDVLKSFIKRDNLMDVAKKFNASNIDLLKEKRRQEQGIRSPSDYDLQILRCAANPDVFPATWDLLLNLFGKSELEEYLEKRAYSPRELDKARLDQDLMRHLTSQDDETRDVDRDQIFANDKPSKIPGEPWCYYSSCSRAITSFCGAAIREKSESESKPQFEEKQEEPEEEIPLPELDEAGVIQPEEDEPLPMGDSNKQVTDDDLEKANESRDSAAAAFSEGDFTVLCNTTPRLLRQIHLQLCFLPNEPMFSSSCKSQCLLFVTVTRPSPSIRTLLKATSSVDEPTV